LSYSSAWEIVQQEKKWYLKTLSIDHELEVYLQRIKELDQLRSKIDALTFSYVNFNVSNALQFGIDPAEIAGLHLTFDPSKAWQKVTLGAVLALTRGLPEARQSCSRLWRS